MRLKPREWKEWESCFEGLCREKKKTIGPDRYMKETEVGGEIQHT
jgi:hypothetical protein